MGVVARTYFSGCWKIREQTRRGNTSEQDVAKRIKWIEYINERAIAKSDEAVADDAEIRRAQHDVQENASKTS